MKGNKKRILFGRMLFFTLSILFSLCIIGQLYLAGMAVFWDATAWMKHIMFIHLFGFNLPFLMLITAVIGSLPHWAYWQLFGMFISIFLMYFTANINTALPWLGSLHSVFAVFLFALSIITVFNTWKFIFKNKNKEG